MQTSGASRLGPPGWPTRCLARPSTPWWAPPSGWCTASTPSPPCPHPSCEPLHCAFALPLAFFTSCSEARLVLSFDPVVSLPRPSREPCQQACVTFNLLVTCIEARLMRIVPNVPDITHTKQDSLLLQHRLRLWHTLPYYQPPGIAVYHFAEHFRRFIVQFTCPAFVGNPGESADNNQGLTMTGKPTVILQSWAHACLCTPTGTSMCHR